jgi:hypothetical protein
MTVMRAKPQTKSARPQDLIHRRDRVLAVLYPPTATHARIIGKGRLRGVVRRHRRGGRCLYRSCRCRHHDDDRMHDDRPLDRRRRVEYDLAHEVAIKQMD